MAQPHFVGASEAQIVSEPRETEADDAATPDKYDALCRWVVAKVENWRTWRDSQYASRWDEYERLWRGIWSADERMRDSERSKIVSPALSEAVENAAAEIEEATFGRGTDYFDLTPYDTPLPLPPPGPPAGGPPPGVGGMGPNGPMPGPMGPEMGPPGAPPGPQGPPMGPMGMTNPMAGPQGGIPPEMAFPGAPPSPEDIAKAVRAAVETIRTNLKEDLGRVDFAANAVKCILNAAVFGLGVGEVVTKTISSKRVATDPATGGPTSNTTKIELGTLRAVGTRNFVYPPSAENVQDCLGVAIEENMPLHTILRGQRDGHFRDEVEVEAGDGDPMLSGDQVGANGSQDLSDAAHVIRYYGLVPTALIYPKTADEEVVDLFGDEDGDTAEIEEDGDYTEALVVIANKSVTIKAEGNPYLLGDRPIVIFPWDIVPGRLNGRGICEKGANSQKVLDAEVRARLDALGLVTAPMMAMDANRMPRGYKFKVVPGASILTAGNPQDILHPFKFGELDPNHWQNLQALQSQVQQATGSVDAAQMVSNMGNARPGAVSMSLAPIIKRYKRTMVQFLDTFLMPALEKIVHRNMQTAPDRYPPVPLKVKAASTMGIMQREYETSQLTQLLSVMEPGTAEHRAILVGLVQNTSIPNREQVLDMIASGEERERLALAMQAMQDADPMAQQLKDVSVQLEMAQKKAEIRKLESEATLNEAKARETAQSSEVNAMQVASKGIYGLPAEQQAAEFDRRWKMAQLALKQADVEEKRADRVSNERITQQQMRASLLRDHLKVRADLHKTRLQAFQKSQGQTTE